MSMHNPPHPGEFINEVYLVPHDVSSRKLAELLDVVPPKLTRVIKGQSVVTPEMAFVTPAGTTQLIWVFVANSM